MGLAERVREETETCKVRHFKLILKLHNLIEIFTFTLFRHFNNNNQDEMEAFFMWLVVTLIGFLLVGIAGIIVYNSCMRVKRAVGTVQGSGQSSAGEPKKYGFNEAGSTQASGLYSGVQNNIADNGS